MTKFIPVESVLNPYDPSILWYPIPGYNGYEISNTGYLRSQKHYHRYPCGILIRPKTQGEDPVFNLSDDNNNRVDVHLSELKNLAYNNPRGILPRGTLVADSSSHNDRRFVKKKTTFVPMDNEPHYAKFTIIDGE